MTSCHGLPLNRSFYNKVYNKGNEKEYRKQQDRLKRLHSKQQDRLKRLHSKHMQPKKETRSCRFNLPVS